MTVNDSIRTAFDAGAGAASQLAEQGVRHVLAVKQGETHIVWLHEVSEEEAGQLATTIVDLALPHVPWWRLGMALASSLRRRRKEKKAPEA
jgi:hypothetical protein